MKTTKLISAILLATAMIFSFNACEDNDNDNNGGGDFISNRSEKLIKTVSGDYRHYEYFYSDKKLVEIKDYQGYSIATLTYSGDSVFIDGYFTNNYYDTRWRLNDRGYVQSGKSAERFQGFYDPSFGSFYCDCFCFYDIKYNSSGNLLEQTESWRFNENDLEDITSNTVIATNKNGNRMECKGEYDYSYTYTYSKYKNKSCLDFRYESIDLYISASGLFGKAPKNLPATITKHGWDNSSTTSFSYEFDEEGYVTEITVTDPSGNIQSYYITYY